MSSELDRERHSIVADLESADEEIRRLAVERVLALPSGEAVAFLVDRLGDPSWRVRKTAVERLVSCGHSERVIDSLIEALSDGENPGRRNSAVEALVDLGAASIPCLLRTLEDPDVDVRKLAVDALAGIGDDTARDALVGMLGDSDSNVRAASVDALGVIGGPDVPGRLAELALGADEDQLVRLSSLRALASLDASIPAADLEAPAAEAVLRPAVYALLGCSDDPEAIGMLVKGVTLRSRGAREAAMAALLQRVSACDDGTLETLGERLRGAFGESREVLAQSFERLREADLPSRLMLVQFLGLVALPECAKPILEAGRDEALAEVVRSTLLSLGETGEAAIDSAWDELDSDLRVAACSVLGAGTSECSVARLREALDAPDRELRTAAASALGERCCTESLEALVQRLQCLDEDEPDWEDERDAVVGALVAFGKPAPEGGDLAEETIEIMASRLDASSIAMRLSIAAVLAEVGNAARDADAELVSVLLRDPNPRVRRAAVRTVATLEPSRSREELRLSLADESPVVRVAAAVALGSSEEEGILDDLRGLLQDEDARSRAAAARAVGAHCARCPDRADEGIALIETALGDHCLVALGGIEALELIGGDAAASAAATVLDRAEVELVQAAAQCVGRHGGNETLGELLALVPHENWMVRAEAIQILGERRFVQAIPAILRSLESEQHDFVRETILGALKRLEE